jgi:glycosyltransferase involved in cell wall biosynthesis
MKIYFGTYQALLMNRGGPTYKIFSLKEHLEKLGVNIDLYDMWNASKQPNSQDLVHLFTANLNTYPLARNLKIAGIPYVVNPIFFSNHSATLIKKYRFLEKIASTVLKRSYSDYTVTQEICEQAIKILPNTAAEGALLQQGLGVSSAKTQVIYNGVEKRFAQADKTLFKQKYGWEDFVLYVGHLGSHRKNGRNIVRALQKLKQPAVIIADVLQTPEGIWCEQQIAKSKNIKLIKWIKHADPLLASAYAACHTFILPTRFETPGRAALEAGLAGANVVITPIGGTKEYFMDFAEYARPDSVQSIVHATEKMLNKKKNSKLQQHILDNFIWEKIAKQTWQMYKQIEQERS